MSDILGFTIIISIDAVLLLISVVLLQGKGSWLIAGYNTSSKEEKKKYNEKKLCQATGAMMLIIAVIFSILTFITYLVEVKSLMNEKILENTAILTCILTVAVVICGMIYTNKYCKIVMKK